MQYLEFTKGSGMWIMLVPATYFLFKVLQNVHLRDGNFLHYLRPFSLLVYVSHGLFLIVFNCVFQMNSVVYFFIVLFGTSLLSVGVVYWSGRFPLLKKLYWGFRRHNSRCYYRYRNMSHFYLWSRLTCYISCSI